MTGGRAVHSNHHGACGDHGQCCPYHLHQSLSDTTQDRTSPTYDNSQTVPEALNPLNSAWQGLFRRNSKSSAHELCC